VRTFIASLVVSLAASLFVAATPAHAARAVIVIRHAEKASESDKDPELSLQGEDRAISLTRFLRHNKVDAIFTSELKRTKATASVLARQRRITPVVVNADDTKALVAAIKALPEDAVVLVVGHSNTVPAILAELGVPDKVTIRDDEYGRVFVVTPTKSGRSGLLEFGY
jgi:2,3-bisphosphoglycerate-dependent phosphoglycerate mutase